MTRLGPLGIPRQFDEWDREMADFAEAVADGGAQHATQPRTMEPAHA